MKACDDRRPCSESLLGLMTAGGRAPHSLAKCDWMEVGRASPNTIFLITDPLRGDSHHEHHPRRVLRLAIIEAMSRRRQ